METYSSHRLIMGKEEIDNFFLLIGDIWNFVLHKCLLSHMTFVQICEFDWLTGRQKGPIFVKMFKNLLLRNHKGDEAETWHTCLKYSSTYVMFLAHLSRRSFVSL